MTKLFQGLRDDAEFDNRVAGIMDLLGRRSKAVASLVKSLKHLPIEHQFAVITSFMSITDLENCVRVQEANAGFGHSPLENR